MEFRATDQLGAVGRLVTTADRDGRQVTRLTTTRSYPSPVDEVWDAVTDPARISRWLSPVSGDLRLGGHYQLEGNAGGEILACDAPRHFAVTWVYGDHTSWVDVTLTAEGDGTLLTLDHDAPSAPDHWDAFGPGAVGIGWELALLGMTSHLAGDPTLTPEEKAALFTQPETVALVTGSNEAWVEAAIAGGDDPEQARAAGERCLAAYTGSPEG
jgi:uncharacterized protein YndB with AHSA1/START domain